MRLSKMKQMNNVSFQKMKAMLGASQGQLKSEHKDEKNAIFQIIKRKNRKRVKVQNRT